MKGFDNSNKNKNNFEDESALEEVLSNIAYSNSKIDMLQYISKLKLVKAKGKEKRKRKEKDKE